MGDESSVRLKVAQGAYYTACKRFCVRIRWYAYASRDVKGIGPQGDSLWLPGCIIRYVRRVYVPRLVRVL